MTKDTCEDCRFFGKNACSDNVTDPKHEKCSEFYRAQRTNEAKESQANNLVELCLTQQPVFFHDQHRTPYVRVNTGGTRVIMPIRSRPFKAWMAGLMWQTEQKAPGTEGVQGALNTLESMALFQGEKHTLYNRVAPDPNGAAVWIDMCDDKWRAIKVSAEGWSIINDPPILFKRYSHQQPLVEPTRDGDPWKLLDFCNIDKTDKNTRLPLMVICTSYLIPTIPHPILVLYGIQGSGKTWLFNLIRRVFDPSSIEVLCIPKDERERVQQLDHHWIAFFDNSTSIPTWISDTICRAATGGGFTKRELYTDDDDVIYNFKRCVGLNGINIAAQRGDLLDRSLLVGLQNIEKENRKTEKQLLAEFEQQKPGILGGFLDTLVKAIQLYPLVNPPSLFRMADFTHWGCAIAIALGSTEEEFMAAYESKVKAQIEEAAHASPVATVLLSYVETYVAPSPTKNWEGTPSDLFKALQDHAKDLEISTRQKGWPKAPNALVRQLNELAPSLKSLGWEVVTSKSGTRRIGINSVPTVQTAPTKKDDRDDKDDKDDVIPSSLGTSSVTLDNILGWLRLEFQKGHNPIREGPKPLEPVEKGKCDLCPRVEWRTHQLQFSDGTRIDGFCLECCRRIDDLIQEFRGKFEGSAS